MLQTLSANNNIDILLQNININMNDILIYIDNNIIYNNHICTINLTQKYIDIINNLLLNNIDIINELNKSYNSEDNIRYRKIYNYIIFKYYNKLYDNYKNNQLLKDKYNNYNDYFIFYYRHFINKYKFNIEFSLEFNVYDLNYGIINGSRCEFKTFSNINYTDFYNLYYQFIKYNLYDQVSVLKHIFINNSCDILFNHEVKIFYFLDLIKPSLKSFIFIIDFCLIKDHKNIILEYFYTNKLITNDIYIQYYYNINNTDIIIDSTDYINNNDSNKKSNLDNNEKDEKDEKNEIIIKRKKSNKKEIYDKIDMIIKDDQDYINKFIDNYNDNDNLSKIIYDYIKNRLTEEQNNKILKKKKNNHIIDNLYNILIKSYNDNFKSVINISLTYFKTNNLIEELLSYINNNIDKIDQKYIIYIIEKENILEGKLEDWDIKYNKLWKLVMKYYGLKDKKDNPLKIDFKELIIDDYMLYLDIIDFNTIFFIIENTFNIDNNEKYDIIYNKIINFITIHHNEIWLNLVIKVYKNTLYFVHNKNKIMLYMINITHKSIYTNTNIFYDKLIDVFLDENETKNFKYIIYIIENKLYNDQQKERIIKYIKNYVSYEEIIKNNRIDRYNKTIIFFEFLLDNNIIELPTLDNYKDHIISKFLNNKLDNLIMIIISRLLREDKFEILEKILLNNKYYNIPMLLQSIIINLNKNKLNDTIIYYLTKVILIIYNNYKSIVIYNIDVILAKLDLIKSYLKDKYINLNFNIKKEEILFDITDDNKYINYKYLTYMLFMMLNKNLELRIDTYNINQKKIINKIYNENMMLLKEENYCLSYSLI